MSDSQQGLPRYFGRGALGGVANALNTHADCIESLDEGLSVHTGSGSYTQGAGGTAFSRQRKQLDALKDMGRQIGEHILEALFRVGAEQAGLNMKFGNL